MRDLSSVDHVKDQSPVNAEISAQPTRALERRVQDLEELLISTKSSTTTSKIVIPNVDIKTGVGGVGLHDTVFYNTGTGLYERALASTTLTSGIFRSNSSALSIGTVVAVRGDKADVMVGGYETWTNSTHRSAMIESTENFVPGVYYLSDKEPGKLTRFAPTLRIQVMLATDKHFVIAPQFGTPESIENVYRVPVGMRPVGGLRQLPDDYVNFAIVGFDAMENYSGSFWRSTKESTNVTYKKWGYVVADANVVLNRPVWIRLQVAAGGAITVFSANTLDELKTTGAIFNSVTSFAAVSSGNYGDVRIYTVTDGSGEVIGTLSFKFTDSETSIPRHIVFRFPEAFQGWKMTNAPITPIAQAIVSSGKIKGVKILEGSVGYTTPPVISFSDDEGSGAEGIAVLNEFGTVVAINMTDEGSAYTTDTQVNFLNQVVAVDVMNAGTGGLVNLTQSGGVITSATVAALGSGYHTAPILEIVDAGGSGYGAILNPIVHDGKIESVQVVDGGSDYVSPVCRVVPANGGYGRYSTPTLQFVDGAGTVPVGALTLSSKTLNRVDIVASGTLYPSDTIITVSGGGASTQATVKAIIENTRIVGVAVLTPGIGYTSAPTLTLSNYGNGHGASFSPVIGASILSASISNNGNAVGSVRAVIADGIGDLEVEGPGSGYATTPSVVISAPDVAGGTQATAVARKGGTVSVISVSTQGTAFDHATVRCKVVSANGGTGGVFQPILDANGLLLTVEVVHPGYGYTAAPALSIVDGAAAPAAGTTHGAVVLAEIEGVDQIVGIEVTNRGTGYINPPTVTIPHNTNESGVAAVAQVKAVARPVVLSTVIAGSGGMRLDQTESDAPKLQISNYNTDLDDGAVTFARPANAMFYYNSKADPEISLRYPANPIEKCLFVLNGIELTNGIFNEGSGAFSDPNADIGLSRKTLFWSTFDMNGCPWDSSFEHLVKERGATGRDCVIQGTGEAGDTDGFFKYWSNLFRYETEQNRAWLHINKASRYHQTNRVASISAMAPLRIVDTISGVEAKSDGTPMTGQLMVFLDNQVNILTPGSDQIELHSTNELVAIYTNNTGRPVVISSVLLIVVFQANEPGLVPNVEHAAKVTVGTQEGNYRNIIGNDESTVASTRLHASNQVKELLPDSSFASPLVMPHQRVFLKVSAPAATPIVKQVVVARLKGHII